MNNYGNTFDVNAVNNNGNTLDVNAINKILYRWHEGCKNGYKLDEESKYLSDFLTINDIKKFNPSIPVFISVPTGRGKNYFIYNILLEYIQRENTQNYRNDKILILVNRTALSRETKLEVSKNLTYTNGNAQHYYALTNFYTPAGIDQSKVFDNVIVLSYQELATSSNDHILLDNNIKYIILDEAHFFTSDSSFNPDTYNILQKILTHGKNAIRIYLTATPNTIFSEVMNIEISSIDSTTIVFDKIQMINNYIKYYGYIPDIPFITANISSDENMLPQYNVPSSIPETRPSYTNKTNKILAALKILSKKDYIHNLATKVYNMQTELNNKYDIYWNNYWYNFYNNKYNSSFNDNITSFCYIYDMVPDYSYINNINVITAQRASNTRTFEEIISLIKKNTSEKWLIFMNNKDNASALHKKLNIENITASFISADNKHSIDNFNYILENKTFKGRILISTSVLDNGINIKDDKLKNVIIDSYDRTLFLHMLGRIRNPKEINLYVFNYTIKDLDDKIKHMQISLSNHCLVKSYPKNENLKNFFSRTPGFSFNINTGDIYSSDLALCYYVYKILFLRTVIRRETGNPEYFPDIKDYTYEANIQRLYIRYRSSVSYDVLKTKNIFQHEKEYNVFDKDAIPVQHNFNDLFLLSKHRIIKQIESIKEGRSKYTGRKKYDMLHMLEMIAESYSDIVTPDYELPPNVNHIIAQYAHWLELPLSKIVIIDPPNKVTISDSNTSEKPDVCQNNSTSEEVLNSNSNKSDTSDIRCTSYDEVNELLKKISVKKEDLEKNTQSKSQYPQADTQWLTEHGILTSSLIDGIKTNHVDEKERDNQALKILIYIAKFLSADSKNSLTKLLKNTNKINFVIHTIQDRQSRKKETYVVVSDK